MDDFDFGDPQNLIRDTCPTCRTEQIVCLADSGNHGNIIAMCSACDEQWDWTPVDHQAILAEAQRGF